MKEFQPPGSGCGSFETPLPPDPEGLLKQLDPEHREGYRLYGHYPKSTVKIEKSQWNDWKPEHAGPYSVAIVWGGLNNNRQQQIVDSMKSEFGEAGISAVLSTTGSAFDPPQEIAHMQAAIREHPDVIVVEPLVPEAFVQVTEEAAAAGIPVVTVDGAVQTSSALDVEPNYVLSAANVLSASTRLMNESGEVMVVHGLNGSGPDVQSTAGWEAVLNNCPNVKIAGEVEGQFSAAQAKGETLKFLATHTQEIGAVVEPGSMNVGVREAFEQAGRPMPIVGSTSGLEKGILAYWRENTPEYVAVSSEYSPATVAGSGVEVTRRLLADQGPKLSTIVAELPMITPFNLEEFSDPSWTTKDPGVPFGTREPFTSQFLEDFFAKPEPLE